MWGFCDFDVNVWGVVLIFLGGVRLRVGMMRGLCLLIFRGGRLLLV